MTRAALLAALVSAALAAAASQEYKPWALESAPFTCEVPADWAPSPGEGLHLVLATPLGAYVPGMHADFYRHGKDGFDSARGFVETHAGTKAVVRSLKVSGVDASRFEVPQGIRSKPEVRVNGKLITRKAQRGVVMLRKAYVVVPGKEGFWVLRYSAEQKEFDRHLPKFEHLLKTFQLKGT